jgi:hypothetical protein
MDFIFGLPRGHESRTGVLVFIVRFSKMVHLAPVAAEVAADDSAELFLDLVFRHHGLLESIVQRGCCSFSVRGRHRLRESLVFLITLRSITRANTSTVR